MNLGDLKGLRSSDPAVFAARAAELVLHEVLGHQTGIADPFDSVTQGLVKPAQMDAANRERIGSLIDHVLKRASETEDRRPTADIRSMIPKDQAKVQALLRPITRKDQ